MRNKLMLVMVFLLKACLLFGQQNQPNKFYTPTIKHTGKSKKKGETMPAPNKGKEIKADTVKDLRFKVKHKKGFNEYEDPKVEEIKKWKDKLRKEHRDTVLKDYHPIPVGNGGKGKTTAAPPIFLNHNFAGTDDAGLVPNDNSVAVSNSGIIISTTNSNVTIQDRNGTVLLSKSLNAFLGYPTTSGILFDAKMIYDDVLDRFFMVVLMGTTPSTSTMIVGYPMTSDPLGSWSSWYFGVPPLCAGNWMDYPSIGINDSSLYVSVNAYNAGYPIIFRLPKAGLLSGVGGWSWQYYYNPIDDMGNQGFTICPLSYGQAGLYGHTMYFVSTVSHSANYVDFWYWDIPTQTIHGIKLTSPNYAIGTNAAEAGSSDPLNVGDCRVKDGFVIYNPSTTDWNMYFTFTSVSSLSPLYNYCIKAKIVQHSSVVSIPTGSWGAYGSTTASADYCYPSIASYGTTGSDENVVMSANVSSASTYPYVVVFSSDVSNNFSGDLLIKSGDSYLDEYDGTKFRWGDYTHLARKFNAIDPIVWVSGCYGKLSHDGGTWIGEIAKTIAPLATPAMAKEHTVKMYPNPTKNDFTLEFDTEKEEACTIQLVGLDGKYGQTLYSENIPEGGHSVSLSTKDLVNGFYVVSIIVGGNLIKSEKLIVQK